MFDRRQFLRTALATTALTGTSRVWGMAPVVRNGQHKFKLSMAAYSYRDYFSGKLQPQLTLEDFIQDCAALGLEGTELTSYYFPKEVTNEYLRHLQDLTYRLGLQISGTSVANDFCFPPGEKREEQIAKVKQWVDYASVMGAPFIRLFSGNIKPDQTLDEARRLCIEGIEQCCAYAGERGVYLALENHGGLTATCEGMMVLVEEVKSPWFAVNLDSGNFHSDKIYEDLARLAPYAVNIQIKVRINGPDNVRKESDLDRLAKIFADAKYRGYIALEYEEKDEEPRPACQRYIGLLRTALQKVSG